MDYFPLFTRLANRSCLLVGAGSVAERKARLLLAAGAKLHVVAPTFSEAFQQWSDEGALGLQRDCYRSDQLRDIFLVIAATNDSATNRQVFEDAERQFVFCNSVDDLSASSAIVPSIVDRSPVLIALSSGGSSPVLLRQLREQLESLIPQGLGRLARAAKRLRPRVAASITDVSLRRFFWERLFRSPAATALVAGADQRHFTAEAEKLIEDSNRSTGEAWLVGAGPGDPGLLTLKALQCMQAADVVLYDSLVSPDILALVRRDAELVGVGKRAGEPSIGQDEIIALLIARVRAGQKVCRLKGGDPFVFGRGGEEMEALREARLSYQVIPGVTAALGCASSAEIPLTHRDHAQLMTVLTAHGKDSIERIDWSALAGQNHTLAIYMGVARLGDIRDRLIEAGRKPKTPFAIVSHGTTSRQTVVTGELATLAEVASRHKIAKPAILYVGAVAGLAKKSFPASGRTTGAHAREESFAVAI